MGKSIQLKHLDAATGRVLGNPSSRAEECQGFCERSGFKGFLILLPQNFLPRIDRYEAKFAVCGSGGAMWPELVSRAKSKRASATQSATNACPR